MVSIDRFSSSENDFFLNHHNHKERSFSSRLDPHFSSLFDDNDVIVRNLKGMKVGSSLLDSVFPLYSGIRRGRYNSYDLSSSLSYGGITDVSDVPQLSGNVRIIPIKLEPRPEKVQDQYNTTFCLLNGPPKHKAAARGDSVLCPGCSFEEFDDISFDPPAWMMSQSSKSHNKYVSNDKLFSEAQLKPKPNENCNANAYNAVIDERLLNGSKLNSPVSIIQHDCYEDDKLENWTTIPVKHIDTSHTSVSDEELNSNNNSSRRSNNNSSRRRYSSTPRSLNSSSRVKYNREASNDSNFRSRANRSRKANSPHSASAASEESHSSNEEANKNSPSTIKDSDEPENHRDEIVSPPRCSVYKELKVRLNQEDRRIDHIEGDGNCLFRAISKCLHGTEKFYKSLRSVLVNLISINKSKFAPFVDNEDVDKHISRMIEDGCWATTCEIYAAATYLQKDIYMLTPDHRNEKYSWLLFQPVFKIDAISAANAHECYITLCNTNGNHYDRIVPDHGGCNCFLPNPVLDGLANELDELSTDSASSTDTS